MATGTNLHLPTERPRSPWSRRQILTQIDIAAAELESHPWLFIVALAVLYVFVIHQRLKPLWYDELFTYYIAGASSFRQMILWTRQVDLNPPLYYILARWTFHFFRPGPTSVRLPAIVSYFVAALGAFQFVGRRSNYIYGFIASLVVLGSTYNYYANEARPYALMLGFLGIAAVCWQSAIDANSSRRWLSLSMLVVAAFCMLLSHVLAMVAYGAFFFAEFARLMVRRKPDWPLWTCMVLPLSSYFLYRPLLQSHSAGVYPPAFQGSIQMLYQDYQNMWNDIAPFLATAMVLIALVGLSRVASGEKKGCAQPAFLELVFAFGLLLVPTEVTVLFMRSHSQFFPRYGITSLFGVAITVPYLLAWWTDNDRCAALIGSFAFAFGIIHPASFARIAQDHIQPQAISSALSGESAKPLREIRPDLPFVDSSGLTFLEMDYRENPAFSSRVYFLIDPAAALQYAHANGFNNLAAIKKIFPVRANVEQYGQFIQEHKKFLVLGTYSFPDDWLLRKLVADGATVRLLGQFPTNYKDRDVYEVTIGKR